MTRKPCFKGNVTYLIVTFLHFIASIWFMSHQFANKIIKDIFIVVRYNVNYVLNFRWIIQHKRKLKGTQNYKIYQNLLTE